MESARKALVVLASLGVAGGTASSALVAQSDERVEERIVDYRIDWVVGVDGSYTVTETIRAIADRRKIRSGIYRDLPMHSWGPFGLRRRHPFEVLGIERNGRSIDVDPMEPNEGDVRVWLGKRRKRIKRGEHVWTFRYRTSEWLGRDGDRDVVFADFLDGWEFPVERFTVAVDLPGAVPTEAIDVDLSDSSSGVDAERIVDEDAEVVITASALRPGERVTGRIAWPSIANTPIERVERSVTELLLDDTSAWIALLGLAVAAGLYWGGSRAARQRSGGARATAHLEPVETPPAELAPVEARFLRVRRRDHIGLVSVLAHAERAGWIDIEKDGPDWVVRRAADRDDGGPELRPLEADVVEALLSARDEVVLDHRSRSRIQDATKRIRRTLGAWHEAVRKRSSWWFLAIVIAVVAYVVSALTGPIPSIAGFMLAWLSFWTVGVVLLVRHVLLLWRRPGSARLAAIPMTLFAIPFVAGELAGLGMIAYGASPWTAVLLLFGLGGAIWSRRFVWVPTALGAEWLTRVEAYRAWLVEELPKRLVGIDDRDAMRSVVGPHVPWALALDVHDGWSSELRDAIDDAVAVRGGHGWLAHTGAAAGLGGALSSATSAGSGGGGGGGGGGGAGGGGGGGGGGGF